MLDSYAFDVLVPSLPPFRPRLLRLPALSLGERCGLGRPHCRARYRCLDGRLFDERVFSRFRERSASRRRGSRPLRPPTNRGRAIAIRGFWRSRIRGRTDAERPCARPGAHRSRRLGLLDGLVPRFHPLGSPGAAAFHERLRDAVGATGALTATVPVEWAIGHIGWRALFTWLSAATVLCAAVLFFVVTDKKSVHPKESLGAVARGLGNVFRSRVFWSIAPFSILHQGAYLSIQSLWAGPWLADVAELPRDEVATHLLMLALSMGVGFIGLGFLAERLGRFGVPTVAIWIGSSIAFQCAQLGLVLEWTGYARGLWSAFGLFGAAGMLSYVILTRSFPIAMAGRVNTGLNVFVFVGAYALQAGIGAIVQHYSEPGAPFSPKGFQMAFGIALALQTLALFWLLTTSPWRQRTRDH